MQGLLAHTSLQPEDTGAHLQVRMLSARMGQAESAWRNELSKGAPWGERLLGEALLASIEGEDEAALEALEQVFRRWSELDSGLQDEVRISLSVDPAA